jgi:hypothetical protein
MNRPTPSLLINARVRATGALVLALTWVLSFALLSGAALTAAGIASVAASLLAIGYATGVSGRIGAPARA